MTVIIEKPAINLREELADLRNQGTYQEQQFYFDGLVTNGTFDADVSGWTSTRSASLALVSNAIQVTGTGTTQSAASQGISTVIGKTYAVRFELVSETGAARFAVSSFSSLGVAPDVLDNTSLSAGTTYTFTFTAKATTTYIHLASSGVTDVTRWDNVSLFETDGTDVVHRMPKGWVPKDVFEDGLLQREGAAHDYEVVYDGFDYYVKPAVAPSATTTTCVIGVRK